MWRSLVETTASLKGEKSSGSGGSGSGSRGGSGSSSGSGGGSGSSSSGGKISKTGQDKKSLKSIFACF